MMTRSPDIFFMSEYIKNVLYFATVRQGKLLKSTAEIHYFSTDDELVYDNYYSDFGPLNLGCVYKFCILLNEKIKKYLNKNTIIYYTSTDPRKKANAAFLLGCYGVLYLSLTPKDALKPLVSHGQTYRPFQDATKGDSIFTITLFDCLQAILKAKVLGFFNFNDFNYEEYEKLDKVQGGDRNWIVPGKFLAFIGPVDSSVNLYHPPEMYIPYFLDNNVQVVIRLNKRMYDGNVFSNVGIMHYDLFFPDGSCPPRHILSKFLQISEDTEGAIAVHCKAGLGRTGSLIGCYLIKHYRMTSHEAIGWMRICRPGSVIGHQQAWLEQLEPWLIKQGNLYRKRNFQDIEKFPIHEFGIYSINEQKMKYKPVMISRPPSPPPPIQRQTRSDTTPPLRPQASRFREVPSKTTEKEHSEWRIRSPKLSATQKDSRRGDISERAYTSRRSSGAGEPRQSATLSSRCPTARINASRAREKNDSPLKNTLGAYGPIPITKFRTTQGPILKTLDDARNFLLKSSMYDEQREKQLQSALTVIPQYAYRATNHATQRTSNICSTSPFPANRTSTIPQHRRRLGRSPSPSPTRSPSSRYDEPSRATNTDKGRPAQVDQFLRDSRFVLKEALSRLKFVAPRDGSVGVASLGAWREAPAGKRAPSVRSDERPLATQGDMLNSIKFQRRLRESIKNEKMNTKLNGPVYIEKSNAAQREKSGAYRENTAARLGFGMGLTSMSGTPKGRTISSGSNSANTGYRLGFNQDLGSSRTPTNQKGLFANTARPASPKGRRSNLSNLQFY